MSDELPDFDALWDYDDPEESERRFRELLPAAKIAGDDAYQLQLLTQIARAQGLQRQFDVAHRTLDSVETRRIGQPLADIRYLLERGRVYNSSGQPEKACEHFLDAWDKAIAAGEDFFAVDAAHMLGIAAPPDDRLDWNLRALSLARSSEHPAARRWQGSLFNNIGWTYHDREQYEDALAMFEDALAWREEQNQPTEILIARWCIARALRSLGRIDEALAMQEELLEIHREAGSSDGYVSEEIGECLLALDRADDARPYFADAYAALSKDTWLMANDRARLERLHRLSGED